MIVEKYTIRLKAESLYLWTLGDVGFGGPRFDKKSFDADCEYLLSKKKRGHQVRVVGFGDYLAATSPSERAALASVKGGKGLYDSTLESMDSSVIKDCDDFLKMVEPFKNDFLVLHSGHHLWDFSRRSIHYGLNNDQYLCKKLNCTYGGVISYSSLLFPNQKTKWNFLAYHGSGAGRLPGSAINRRFHAHSAFYAHAVYAGHDNKRAADCGNYIWNDENQETHYIEKRSICTGSYERAYQVGEKDGYVEEAVMQPSALGAQITMFEPIGGKLRVRALV